MLQGDDDSDDDEEKKHRHYKHHHHHRKSYDDEWSDLDACESIGFVPCLATTATAK